MPNSDVRLKTSLRGVKALVSAGPDKPAQQTLVDLKKGLTGVVRSGFDKALKVVEFGLGEDCVATVDMHQDHLEFA